jgi:hypothetical protein
MMCYKIKWKRPWPAEDIRSEEFLLSTGILLGEADALFSEWEPAWELIHFKKPKVWYCCEPRDSWKYGEEKWKAVTSTLLEDEKLNHWHPIPACRVPHITHVGPIQANTTGQRKEAACTIVSNSGRKQNSVASDAMRLRTAFCTFKGVDLYGRADEWRHCKSHFWSSPGLPANYKGELAGADWVEAKIRLMSGYKVAVCLENSHEPHYFTDKFLAAVRAGCIPVYQAHDTVRQSILNGAKWVDPANFGFDPAATLKAALSEPIESYWEANAAWAQNPIVKSTEREHVLRHIATLLSRRIAGVERGSPLQPSN